MAVILFAAALVPPIMLIVAAHQLAEARANSEYLPESCVRLVGQLLLTAYVFSPLISRNQSSTEEFLGRVLLAVPASVLLYGIVWLIKKPLGDGR